MYFFIDVQITLLLVSVTLPGIYNQNYLSLQ